MKKNLKQNLRDLAARLKASPALVEFQGQTIVIAKNQPQYYPLPAYRYKDDPEGRLVCCWKFSWRDRLRIFFGCPIWHTVLTFNTNLQPQMISTDRPDMPVIWPRVIQCADCGNKTMSCECGAVVPIGEVCDIFHIGKCPNCGKSIDEACPERTKQL